MRIAIVTTSYPAHPEDASGHFVATEAEQLAALNHEVNVFAPSVADAAIACPAPAQPVNAVNLTAHAERADSPARSPHVNSVNLYGSASATHRLPRPNQVNSVNLRDPANASCAAAFPQSGNSVHFAPETATVHVRRLPGGNAFGWPGTLSRLRAKPWRIVDAAGFAWQARRALSEFGPFDQVIAHWLLPCGFPIAFDTPSKLCVVIHGSDARLFTRLPGLVQRRILRALARRGAHLRFVSAELREQVFGAQSANSRQAYDSADTSVEPAAIDVSTAEDRCSARNQLGIADKERLIVLVSRLVPKKRVQVALQAADLLDARVVVVGDGPEAPALKARFPNVHFTGLLSRSEALNWISAADLILSASREEGAPSVIREARALGTQVVSVPAGDLLDWARSDPGLWLTR